jgi:hypothetical protein
MRFTNPTLLCLLGAAAILGCRDDNTAVAEPDTPALEAEAAHALASSQAVVVSNVTVRSGKSYRAVKGGLVAGANRYIDRSDRFRSSLPSDLTGATYLETANADADASLGMGGGFLTFAVDRDAVVYVAHDTRLKKPTWLTKSFRDTGWRLATSRDRTYRVYERTYSKGTVSLGSNLDSAEDGTMYTVAVQPASTTTPSDPDPDPGPGQGGGNHEGWFVTPGGGGSSCSQSSPCSLSTALGKSGEDTVWLREGSYGGFNLARANAVVRAFPGERVRINGSVSQNAPNGVLWGLEVYQSNPTANNLIGITAYGVGTKLINNVVHDAGNTGIGFWWNTQGGEAYGNIVYNNGTHDNLDHGIYFNNKGPATKKLGDNVVFNNWAYGFHGYSGSSGELTNIQLDGNVGFGGHGIGKYVSDDILIGGTAVQDLVITDQYTYKPDGFTSVDLGYVSGSARNGTVTVNGGVFVGSPGLQLNRWATVRKSGATEINFSSRPSSGTIVEVRANKYEAGRGHVIVYNWSGSGSVSANLSSVLRSGQPYTVHNVCDLYGSPVAGGTYSGGSVSLSMATMRAPSPIGRSARRPPPDCGGKFAVFLVQGR